MSPTATAATIAIYLAALFLPGGIAGYAAGLRGWLLAGAAPLLSYAIAGLTGPWLAAIGVPFTIASFALAAAVLICVAFGLRLLHQRRLGARRAAADTPGPWRAAAHIAVIGCVLAAAAIGLYTVLHGMGRLDAIPQDWDAAFHANGIRYLTETGDGSLTGMSSVNKYGDGTPLFYPNAYHLLASLVHQLTGASIAAVLNANTVLLPGLLALSLATLVREFRGRAVLAGTAALVAIAPVTLLYTSMNRGPLLPFLLGVTLTPIAAIALHRLLTRKGIDTGLVFVLVAVGLVTIHTSTLFTGILFALPMLLQRWLSTGGPSGAGKLGVAGRTALIGKDLGALAIVAVVSAIVAGFQLWGAYNRPTEFGPQIWPAVHDIRSAVGALAVFQHEKPTPQLWLGAALLLGVMFLWRLDALRWIGGTALLTGLAWVAVASSNSKLVVDLSQPWWNDPYRFMTMAALPLTFIAAHGLATLQAAVGQRVAGMTSPASPLARQGIAAGLAALVLVGFAGGTKLLYTESNAAAVGAGYGSSPRVTVSPDEARAMLELAAIAKPGEWAMNDRFDGTVWTYAVSGVRTVAAHYDTVRLAPEAELLARRFRDYPSDQAVRDVVDRLNVRWVIVGKTGFMRDRNRTDGLSGYPLLGFLTEVYDNPGATIYRIDGAAK